MTDNTEQEQMGVTHEDIMEIMSASQAFGIALAVNIILETAKQEGVSEALKDAMREAMMVAQEIANTRTPLDMEQTIASIMEDKQQ